MKNDFLEQLLDAEDTFGCCTGAAHNDTEEPDTPTLIAEAAKPLLGKAVGEWVNVLDKWIKGCDSLEEADAQLAQVFDKLKDRKFTQVLERHNTLAHLAGIAEIIDEDIDNE